MSLRYPAAHQVPEPAQHGKGKKEKRKEPESKKSAVIHGRWYDLSTKSKPKESV